MVVHDDDGNRYACQVYSLLYRGQEGSHSGYVLGTRVLELVGQLFCGVGRVTGADHAPRGQRPIEDHGEHGAVCGAQCKDVPFLKAESVQSRREVDNGLVEFVEGILPPRYAVNDGYLPAVGFDPREHVLVHAALWNGDAGVRAPDHVVRSDGIDGWRYGTTCDAKMGGCCAVQPRPPDQVPGDGEE